MGAAANVCSAAQFHSRSKYYAAVSIENAILTLSDFFSINTSTEVEGDKQTLSSLFDGVDAAAVSLANSKLWNRSLGPISARWNEVKAELLRTVTKEEARGMGTHLDAAERRRLMDLEAEDWGVWTEWYDRRLRGEPPNEALEIERVTSEAIPWAQGPKLANRALREIEEKHRLLRLHPAQTPRVNPETGEIGREPLAERPPVKENFTPAGAVLNHADALREIMDWQREQPSWNQEYRFLDFPFKRLLRLLDQSPLHPDRIHDACEFTVTLLDGQIAVGGVSKSPETAQLRLLFDVAARDIRLHYPDLAATHAARAGTTVPPTDEARREQLAEAVKALSAILEKEYAEALREDVEAVRLSDAELPEGEALSTVDLGERRRLAENLARIWLMLRDGGKKALEVVDDQVTRAKKLTEYAKVARELGKIWDELKDWIDGFL